MNTHGIPTVMPPLWCKVSKGGIDLMSTSWSWKWIKINSLNSSHLQLTWNTSVYSKWITDSQQWDLHPWHGL